MQRHTSSILELAKLCSLSPSQNLLFNVMHAVYRHFSSAAELQPLFLHRFKNKNVQIHVKKRALDTPQRCVLP